MSNAFEIELRQTLEAIEALAASSGYTESTICRMAGHGGDFAKRIRAGRQIHPITLQAARDWIAANQGLRNKKGAA